MNWYFLFYLISIAEKVSVFLSLMAAASIVASIFTFAYAHIEEEDKAFGWGKILVIACFIFGGLSCLIPSKSDFMLIIGGGTVGQYVSNSEEIQALPDEVVKYFRSELQKAQRENLPDTTAN
jgi:hypothetical protein